MRVVAGLCKGHKLTAPEGFGVRPTTDRVKEAIFSSVSDRIYSCVFLDLFAGSGSIGIEALSRQAKQVFFVEESSEYIGIIEKNINHIKKAVPNALYKVINADAILTLDNFGKNGIIFDCVFLDPPYGSSLLTQSIKSIYSLGLLDKGGIIIAETLSDTDFLSEEYVNIIKRKQYGRTTVYYIDFKFTDYK